MMPMTAETRSGESAALRLTCHSKWLTFALEVTHRERQSNIDLFDYAENRAVLTITATY